MRRTRAENTTTATEKQVRACRLRRLNRLRRPRRQPSKNSLHKGADFAPLFFCQDLSRRFASAADAVRHPDSAVCISSKSQGRQYLKPPPDHLYPPQVSDFILRHRDWPAEESHGNRLFPNVEYFQQLPLRDREDLVIADSQDCFIRRAPQEHPDQRSPIWNPSLELLVDECDCAHPPVLRPRHQHTEPRRQLRRACVCVGELHDHSRAIADRFQLSSNLGSCGLQQIACAWGRKSYDHCIELLRLALATHLPFTLQAYLADPAFFSKRLRWKLLHQRVYEGLHASAQSSEDRSPRAGVSFSR